MDKYIIEPKKPIQMGKELGEHFVIGFWKVDSGRFPVLSKATQNLFAIPTFMAASEWDFNTLGKVLDLLRISLSRRSIQSLLCTQD